MKRFVSTNFNTSLEVAIANCLKAVPKSQIVAFTCFSLLLAESIFTPTVIALDEKELHQLCSSFPLNSQCKDYEAPIPLDNRSGKKADCIFKNKVLAEKCDRS